MRKIAARTSACLLLVLFMIGGFSIYLIKYAKDGDKWVTFQVNRHVYSNAVLSVGTITDKNGYVLATMEDGRRIFSESLSRRKSSLHVVGDIEGNIGTGALNYYATELMGYNMLNGVYSHRRTGNTITLTVDIELNRVAYEALDGRKGAIVFYNYLTGEVLCMVSAPSYDPYSPPEDYLLELGEYDGAYINRCISSSFTPGSIFKVVTLAAAIETIEDLFEMQFYCSGSTEIAGEIITCSSVHGHCDIYDAFAGSCNVAFAELSQILGGDTLYEYTKMLGLLDSFELSKIPVAKGSFIVAPEKSSNLSWSGIGQYDDLVNPLAMTRLMAAIANKGVAVNPKIISSIKSEYNLPTGFSYNLTSSKRLMSEETAEILSKMLRYNCTSVYDGYYSFSSFSGLSAKSGTAEMRDGKLPHAWFAGFINDSRYPVAFTVLVENSGWGLQHAAPIVNKVLNEIIS